MKLKEVATKAGKCIRREVMVGGLLFPTNTHNHFWSVVEIQKPSHIGSGF